MAWRKEVKPGSENAITRAIRYFLRIKRVFHKKIFQTLGSEPGISDIIGCLKTKCECGREYGRFLAVEIKTSKGKLSPAQEQFLKDVNDNGGLGIVARSVEDVMEVIK